MTVRQAIEHLLSFPLDATLIHTMCSEYMELEKEHFSLKIPWTHDEYGVPSACVRHGPHGQIMQVRPGWIPPDKPQPEFLTCVHIVGN